MSAIRLSFSLGVLIAAQSPAQGVSVAPPSVNAAAQLATGVGFNDADFGFNTRDHRMSLLGVTMSANGPRVSNALLLFVLEGSFLDGEGTPSGESTRLTAEWTSELALGGGGSAGSGVYLAGQLARDGAGFRADLAGIGVHAATPIGADVWITAYGRVIEGSHRDVKTRFEWEAPFHIGRAALRFDGYEDVVDSRTRSPEWSGILQLLVRAGRLVGRPDERVEVGLKWFNHVQAVHATSAPLLMMRWML
ncbi:MAG: hypothetical protein ABJF01_03645 [bacterium]